MRRDVGNNPSGSKIDHIKKPTAAILSLVSAAALAACNNEVIAVPANQGTPSASSSEQPSTSPTPTNASESPTVSEVPTTQTPGIETTEPVETAEPGIIEYAPIQEWVISEEMESTLTDKWGTLNELEKTAVAEQFFADNLSSYISPEDLKQLDVEGATYYIYDRLGLISDLAHETEANVPNGFEKAANLLDAITQEVNGENQAKEEILAYLEDSRELMFDPECSEVANLCELDRHHFDIHKILGSSEISHPRVDSGGNYNGIETVVQTKDPTVGYENIPEGISCMVESRVWSMVFDDNIGAQEFKIRYAHRGGNVIVSFDGGHTKVNVDDLVDNSTISCS